MSHSEETRKACKHGNVGCGTQYDCGPCTRELHVSIWKKMTPEQRNYDRMVDPMGAYTSGLSAPGGDAHIWDSEPEACCSCHISPPCSYCVNKSTEEES